MNSKYLKAALISISLSLLILPEAKAECCPGLEYFIGFIAVVAGLPILIGIIFLLANLTRLKKALRYITFVWLITIGLYGLYYFFNAANDEYRSGYDEDVEWSLFLGILMPITALLGLTLVLYLIKEGVSKFIKAKREYEEKDL